MKQTPSPGENLIFHRGDMIEFFLTTPHAAPGAAFLRTNIGQGNAHRSEIIDHVEKDSPILSRDWHDLHMFRLDGNCYQLRLPLLEVGRFEAKAFFLPEGTSEPVWPEGSNTSVKVEPAHCCSSNTIYCAFVRLFGPDMQAKSLGPEQDKAAQALEAKGYSFIPLSGTFRNLIKELDFIIGKMKFRVIQLLPVHPTPTTYARMGRFGSPYAVLDYMDVDTSLAEFDRKTTPLDQFQELIDAVHARGASIFMDIPLNHTGWASTLQVHNPSWFARGSDSHFVSPEAWGVTWGDLARLDYSHTDLWTYMARMLIFWCRRGVDGFRCDAGYMIPAEAWEYIVARVRDEFHDTVFLLEGLGGPPQATDMLLTNSNLNWAYSELFQNYDRPQVEHYLQEAGRISAGRGLLVHFAETHDNNRLAARSQTYARMRTALSAMCSQAGAFGITCGVEWFADEKIHVHSSTSLKWGNYQNQAQDIARLNAIMEVHPAFHHGATITQLQEGPGNCIALLRRAPAVSPVLVLANLADDKPVTVTWKPHEGFNPARHFHDLISGKEFRIAVKDNVAFHDLLPGEVLCLSEERKWLGEISEIVSAPAIETRRNTVQRLKAKALEIHTACRANSNLTGLNPEELAGRLCDDPMEFLQSCASDKKPTSFTVWQWPRDMRRTVMIPPGHFLFVRSSQRFTAEIVLRDKIIKEQSFLCSRGGHFAIFSPLSAESSNEHATICMTSHDGNSASRNESPILLLPEKPDMVVNTTADRSQVRSRDLHALCTNGRGAMSLVRGAWGQIRSQYDCLLAGSLDPRYPVDRRIMLTRCRAWLGHRGYSHAINLDSLEDFSAFNGDTARWRFNVPAGHGKIVDLRITLKMMPGENRVVMKFHRTSRKEEDGFLEDAAPVKIILRFDIEDRSFHEKTKAFLGPEKAWQAAIQHTHDGFTFSPSQDRSLHLRAATAKFTGEAEWQYMVGHPVDAERGLDGSSDLFSPGYFTLILKGGESSPVDAAITIGRQESHSPVSGKDLDRPIPQTVTLADAMKTAMRQFIVKRDDSQTVIAGYPWFLDWGRDTLICLRGIIAAGFRDEARRILTQFARFEDRGTIPNMIHGSDASNRDTSDAPLWFFVACSDLVHAEHSADFLDADCGGRTVKQALLSIAEHYVAGTPNGIKMDEETGLIFSPSHFTWMDTNHPACSPRQGYPVEIQALWYFAARFLGVIEAGHKWTKLSTKVAESIKHLYPSEEAGGLSDCLHCSRGTGAVKAVADDAVRPNQLFAVTLGAITDLPLIRSVVSTCGELVVPGAMRSLADRPVRRPIRVEDKGKLLNDPVNPYWGEYSGDEDTRRKPAYHNGTAWTWLFPSYCEAFLLAYGPQARTTALTLLSSSLEAVNSGCLCQVPELCDGNSPHMQKGCAAQAWGVTELYRMLAVLETF